MRCNARAVYLRAQSTFTLAFLRGQCGDVPKSVDKATSSPFEVFAVRKRPTKICGNPRCQYMLSAASSEDYNDRRRTHPRDIDRLVLMLRSHCDKNTANSQASREKAHGLGSQQMAQRRLLTVIRAYFFCDCSSGRAPSPYMDMLCFQPIARTTVSYGLARVPACFSFSSNNLSMLLSVIFESATNLSSCGLDIA